MSEIISVKFVCINQLCQNYNVEYYWINLEEKIAECGGCKAILEAIIQYSEEVL